VSPPFLSGPVLEAETWVWKARRGEVEVRFTGRGAAHDREEALRAIAPEAPLLAWAKQVHSAVALPARPGACGEGDALFTEDAGLALSVVTADCVPILLAGPERLAAIHAGWRGIAAGVIPATLDRLNGRLGEWTAWIGPAIGACCYEVGEDVAEQVVAATGSEVAVRGPAGRPHLDLAGAARLQLAAAGVGEVIVLPRCTRCDEE
jgi:YfiH family protein